MRHRARHAAYDTQIFKKRANSDSLPLRHLALMLSSHDAKHGKHQEGDYQADGNDDKRVKPIPHHPGIPRQLMVQKVSRPENKLNVLPQCYFSAATRSKIKWPRPQGMSSGPLMEVRCCAGDAPSTILAEKR